MSKSFQLLMPGIDPIQEYGDQEPARKTSRILIGPFWLVFLLAGCGLLARATIFAAPDVTPTPLPTIAQLPTVTATATASPTATATASITPTATVTANPTGSPTLTATASPTATATATATLEPWINGLVIDAPNLNIRYGPGTAWPPFDQLRRGDQVRIIGRDNGARWGFIDRPVLGWLSMAYIESESIARLPVMVPMPPRSE